MKNYLVILVLLFVGNVVLAQAKPQTTETVKITTSAVCDMCVKTISEALKFEKGVDSFQFNESNVKELTVTYNSKKTSVEKIVARINKTGYDANESPAHEKAYDKLHECCKKDSH